MVVHVLLVCLGNICRSPTAHGLLQYYVDKAGLNQKIIVDSAGTGDWHIGHSPDARAQSTALEKGYDISHLRARQVVFADFDTYDYILGMDQQNVNDLLAMCPDTYGGVCGLFLDIAGAGSKLEVPDPYYGDQQHFEAALELIENGVKGLLSRIQKEHAL